MKCVTPWSPADTGAYDSLAIENERRGRLQDVEKAREVWPMRDIQVHVRDVSVSGCHVPKHSVRDLARRAHFG